MEASVKEMLQKAFGGNGETFEVKFVVGGGEEQDEGGGLHGLLSKFMSEGMKLTQAEDDGASGAGDDDDE